MDIPNNLLSLILFTPTVVGLLILLLPKEEVKLARWVAFLGSLIPFALSLPEPGHGSGPRGARTVAGAARGGAPPGVAGSSGPSVGWSLLDVLAGHRVYTLALSATHRPVTAT